MVSNVQTNFLGGIWSPLVQGRMADPLYATGLNESLNGWPTEEQAWIRRPGFRVGGFTRNAKRGIIRAISVNLKNDYGMEFTDGHLRFWNGTNLVTESQRPNVVSISGATPASVRIDTPEPTWATGDQVLFQIDAAGAADAGALIGRTFKITVVDDTHFTITDPVTNLPFDGSTVTTGNNNISVAKVVDLATPYTSEALWSVIKVAKKRENIFVFHPTIPTRKVTVTGGGHVWTIQVATFVDGPYLDPVGFQLLNALGAKS